MCARALDGRENIGGILATPAHARTRPPDSTMRLLPRLIRPQLFIDANRVNARGSLPKMNLLEAWHANGVIALRMPWNAQIEAEVGTDLKRRLKARSYLAPVSAITTVHEQQTLEKIGKILFPNGITTNSERNDCLIVFTTWKYALSSNAVLVTADGASKGQPRGILGSAEDLRRDLNVRVMSDEEAVVLVRRKVSERDSLNKARAKVLGIPLPEWHGRDG